MDSLNLSRYEVLDCEPLHDVKGHLYNLLPEIPNLLQSNLGKECQQLLDTTLPKQKVSGAHLRVAALKLYTKLKHCDIDPLLKELLSTIIRISELLYQSAPQKLSCASITLLGFTMSFTVISYQILSIKVAHISLAYTCMT